MSFEQASGATLAQAEKAALLCVQPNQTRSHVLAKAGSSVGLFGALETQQLAGPIRAGIDYVARTRLLKLSESPKTENSWYEVIVGTPDSGADVCRVLYYLRFMKASSPLWVEGQVDNVTSG